MVKENLNVEVIKIEEPAPGPLKLFDLYSIALGTVIGAGVITMIGFAIGYTGYSAWLAYLAAIVFGFLQNSPFMFMSGTFRLSGGTYSIIGHNFSEFWAGVAGITFIPMLLSIGMLGSAFGAYMQSLIPSVSPAIWGVGLIVVFYLINISGIEATSKIQNVMLLVLVSSLMAFIVFGIPHIVNPIFDFKGGSFMPKGFWGGFFPAVILLSNSCGGYLTLSPQFGVFSKNATRDIPRAQLLIIPTLVLLYVGTGIVASGVLPFDQIAGQPLTLTAQAIFPGYWYLVFIIGGPIMCLATTTNGTLPAMAQVLVTTADSGWLPKIFAKRNKKGIALAPLTLAAVLGIAPIVLGFNPRDIILMVSFSASILSLPLQLAFFNMPRRHPQAWKNSRMHIPNWIYYILCSLSLFAQAFLLYNSVTQLPLKVILVNFVFAMAVVGGGLYRAYSGKVKVVMSIWPRSAHNDADWEKYKLAGKVQEIN